jgi:PAS domain S-box-containing protein
LISYFPIEGAHGIDRAACILQDITERKRTEQAVRESEETFRSVFRDAGVGMVIVSLEGQFLAANKAFCDCLGYKEEELLEKTVESVTLPEDWPAFSKKLREALIEGHGFQWFEKRCLHKSGRIIYTQSSASLIQSRQGLPKYFVAEVLDVTNRKQAEQALAEMTRKLIKAGEQERTRIGRELHDDISQRLAMLALELEQLQQNPSEAQSRLPELRKRTIEISSDVQALSHDLHSSRLEYLGVVAGIKGWCKEFGERHAVGTSFSNDVPGALPLEIGLPLFRVVQEALHNAVKHSGVKHIEVRLWEELSGVHLTIADNGVGFDVETAMLGPGLGLTSMRERVRLVNGTIVIDSEPNRGTTIHVRVPLESEQAKREAV